MIWPLRETLNRGFAWPSAEAAGLAVAIPAVLAYNIMGRAVSHIEIELEGFAQDLLNLLTGRQR